MNELDDGNFIDPSIANNTPPYTEVDRESSNVGDPDVTPLVDPGTKTVDNETDRTSPNTQSNAWFNDLLKQVFGAKKDGSPNFSGGQMGIAALLAFLANKYDTQKPTGGGVGKAYAGYTPYTRTMGVGPMAQPGIPGQPIARYAGVDTPPVVQPPPAVQATELETSPGPGNDGYARGGIVALEDGGFVMTKKAVDGAGGPDGIRRLVPGARPLRGPGTGTSDSIPAKIHGSGGAIPAAVSNGEAYIPPRHVQQAGGSPALYSLMNRLQKGR